MFYLCLFHEYTCPVLKKMLFMSKRRNITALLCNLIFSLYQTYIKNFYKSNFMLKLPIDSFTFSITTNNILLRKI